MFILYALVIGLAVGFLARGHPAGHCWHETP